ncbi:MAG: GGDEF domain-containing protein [Tenericutes bacterium]|nr:GGDEF domain-containing protein [Mycoplasmatota bacterium]
MISEIMFDGFNDLSFALGKSIIHIFSDVSHKIFYENFETVQTQIVSLGFTAVLVTQEKALVFMLNPDDRVLLFLIGLHQVVLPIIDEMILINNEQMGLIKSLYVKLTRQKDEMGFYEEIMKLNNLLINTRRELRYKNIELKKLNLDLEKSNFTDYLTNAFNRRKFFIDIYELPKQESYTLVMIDFNNFRMINNDYGHSRGDEALLFFTRSIQERVSSEGGLVYRLGGDEFVFLIPGNANINIDDLIETLNTQLKQFHKLVSISYGMTVVDSKVFNQKTTAEEILHLADQKMYQFKTEYKRKTELKQ